MDRLVIWLTALVLLFAAAPGVPAAPNGKWILKNFEQLSASGGQEEYYFDQQTNRLELTDRRNLAEGAAAQRVAGLFRDSIWSVRLDGTMDVWPRSSEAVPARLSGRASPNGSFSGAWRYCPTSPVPRSQEIVGQISPRPDGSIVVTAAWSSQWGDGSNIMRTSRRIWYKASFSAVLTTTDNGQKLPAFLTPLAPTLNVRIPEVTGRSTAVLPRSDFFAEMDRQIEAISADTNRVLAEHDHRRAEAALRGLLGPGSWIEIGPSGRVVHIPQLCADETPSTTEITGTASTQGMTGWVLRTSASESSVFAAAWRMTARSNGGSGGECRVEVELEYETKDTMGSPHTGRCFGTVDCRVN